MGINYDDKEFSVSRKSLILFTAKSLIIITIVSKET